MFRTKFILFNPWIFNCKIRNFLTCDQEFCWYFSRIFDLFRKQILKIKLDPVLNWSNKNLSKVFVFSNLTLDQGFTYNAFLLSLGLNNIIGIGAQAENKLTSPNTRNFIQYLAIELIFQRTATSATKTSVYSNNPISERKEMKLLSYVDNFFILTMLGADCWQFGRGVDYWGNWSRIKWFSSVWLWKRHFSGGLLKKLPGI